MNPSVEPDSSAVVLGAGVNGLGMIRALAEGGVRTLGAYVQGEEENLGRFSRHCRPMEIPGGPGAEGALLQRLMAEGGAAGAPPVLFPTSDRFVQWMSQHRETLAERFLFNLPAGELLDRITNKDTATADAREAGLTVPATMIPVSVHEWNTLAGELEYPAIIKPINSFSVDFPGKNVPQMKMKSPAIPKPLPAISST